MVHYSSEGVSQTHHRHLGAPLTFIILFLCDKASTLGASILLTVWIVSQNDIRFRVDEK